MESIKLNNWQEVTDYIDNGFWQPAPSYFEHIVQHGNYYPQHAFSKGKTPFSEGSNSFGKGNSAFTKGIPLVCMDCRVANR